MGGLKKNSFFVVLEKYNRPDLRNLQLQMRWCFCDVWRTNKRTKQFSDCLIHSEKLSKLTANAVHILGVMKAALPDDIRKKVVPLSSILMGDRYTAGNVFQSRNARMRLSASLQCGSEEYAPDRG